MLGLPQLHNKINELVSISGVLRACGEGQDHLELTVPSGPLPSGETSVFYFVVIIMQNTCMCTTHHYFQVRSQKML